MPLWYGTCHVRLGIRVQDWIPRIPAPDLVTPGSGPEVFADAGYLPIGNDIVPYSCQVTLNSYRKADTAKVKLPLGRLPIDPRLIRGLQLQVFGGCIGPDEYANIASVAVGRRSEFVFGQDADPITGNTYELFRGFVVTHEVEEGDDDDVVELEAQDLTAIFIGAELPEQPLKDIPASARLDEVIQLLLYGDGVPVKDASRRFGLPGARGTVITNDTGVSPLPRLSDFAPPAYFIARKRTTKGRAPAAGKKQSYWDIITELCQAAGFKPYIRRGVRPTDDGTGRLIIPGAELVISQPGSFYAMKDAQSLGGNIRRFNYGETYEKLRLKRSYASGDIPTTVEVRAYDTSQRQTAFARYPKKGYANRAGTTRGEREEIMFYTMPPIGGPDMFPSLCRTAIGLYEERGRKELEILLTGSNLSALDTFPSRLSDGSWNPDLADMFWAMPGDRIELGRLPPRLQAGGVATPMFFDALTRSERTDLLTSQGYPEQLAAALAEAAEAPQLQRFFNIEEVDWNWSLPDGGGGEDGAWDWKIQARSYFDTRNSRDAVGSDCETGYVK